MLLAIETSSRVGSVALMEAGAVVARRRFEHGLQNAARVLPLIDEMCREAGITARGIGEVAVSIGPGSFTGLRIGVTLAKSLCYATGAKLIAVPTMPVMAMNAPRDATFVMPIIDAKRDQVFAGLYRRESVAGELVEVEAPQLLHLPELLAQGHRPLLLLGEGVTHHRAHIESAGPDITIADEALWWPMAETVAQLAMRLREQGAFADPFKLTPLYIRKPEAQERMEAGLLKHLQG